MQIVRLIYPSAVHTIINPAKLLDGLVHHRLDTLEVRYIDFNSNCPELGVLGEIFTILNGLLSTREIFVGKDNSKSSSFSEGITRLAAYARGALTFQSE